MTPYELCVYVDVYNQSKKAQDEEKLYLTYINALWTSRLVWQKKPQSYEQLTKKRENKKMTPQEMFAEVLKINSQLEKPSS